MDRSPTIGEELRRHGISRRTLIQFCTAVAATLALPAGEGVALAASLAARRRPSVIYISFQECTGCLESLVRSFTPSVETLIFDVISLDFNDTLQAAAGTQAEGARKAAMAANEGQYLLVVDGAVPVGNPGYCTIAGESAETILRECAAGAAAVVAVGTCATYGGLPRAAPDPTGGRGIAELLGGRPVVNVPGCPPIAEVITAVLVHYVASGKLPPLDALGRPLAFYGTTIHDRCYRRAFYDEGKFAKTFDDEGARNGYCLFELGCKGPTTYNACATVKWNGATSFPIQSGHGCLGCSQPGFWDKGGFYQPLSAAIWPAAATDIVGGAAVGGAILGGVAAWAGRRKQRAARPTPPADPAAAAPPTQGGV